MIFRLFGRAPTSSVPHEIYGAVMTQSRQREFYSQLGVPDTVLGRLEMLCLHLVLVSHRLASESQPIAKSLNQEIFDEFTSDLDRTLREMGIGDTSVPKRKKRLVHSYYGQVDAFAPALDGGDLELLRERIEQRFFHNGDTGNPAALAAYMIAAQRKLAGLSLQDLLTGHLEWPATTGWEVAANG